MSPRLNLQDFSRIVVLTGAGVSVASGLNTYRGPGGLWTQEGALSTSAVSSAPIFCATAEAIQSDPEGVWRFFSERRQSIGQAQPNAAHRALAAAAEGLLRPGASLTVITQNVDGLHQLAGSSNVVELHGSLWRTRCSAAACDFRRDEDLTRIDPICPACPQCGAWLRPDVVLFHEPLPGGAEYFAKRSLRDCDLFLAIGTSGSVSPAANFVRSARFAGARTLYLNIEPLPADHSLFDQQLIGPAEALLPALLGVA